MKKQPKSIYIHMPFCVKKCNYCSFVSFSDKKNLTGKYTEALKEEILSYASKDEHNKIQSLYFGGGTPSVVELNYLEEIVNQVKSTFSFENNCEITIEINPATVDLEYLKGLKQIGFNRLSIGVQSFDDKMLKILGRVHGSNDATDTVKNALAEGFENISIDLIYGLPEQTLEQWRETLKKAVSLNIKHISLYGLKIEAGTPFYSDTPKNLPDDELCADMYKAAVEKLTNNGFEHYEISNFAKKSFESKHNLTYWNNQEYFGFGLGAHGYIEGERYSNTVDFEEYLKKDDKIAYKEKLSEQKIIEEAIFLGLRLRQGIDIEEFKKLYDFDLIKNHKTTIDKYLDYRFMTIENGCLKLTIDGVLLSNSILADFII